ncbi:hypothetical protein NPIL_617691, partial [Nephila pilipes]
MQSFMSVNFADALNRPDPIRVRCLNAYDVTASRIR